MELIRAPDMTRLVPRQLCTKTYINTSPHASTFMGRDYNYPHFVI